MTNYDEDKSRGEFARQVLENPEYKAAMAGVRAALLDAIALTPAKDAEMREFLYRSVRTLPMLTEVLTVRMNNGVIAAGKLIELAREMDEQADKPRPKSRGR